MKLIRRWSIVSLGCLAIFKMNRLACAPLTITATLTYDKVIVRTATRSTSKMAANLTQILNFKVNFHQEFELFYREDQAIRFQLTFLVCESEPFYKQLKLVVNHHNSTF